MFSKLWLLKITYFSHWISTDASYLEDHRLREVNATTHKGSVCVQKQPQLCRSMTCYARKHSDPVTNYETV